MGRATISIKGLEWIADNQEDVRLTPTIEGGGFGKIHRSDDGLVYVDKDGNQTPITEGSTIYIGQQATPKGWSFPITRYVPRIVKS